MNVRGKFISAEALRSRCLCMAARSLAAGVFTGKNDPKGIHGVPGVDGTPIGKNTNNWKCIDRVPDVDGRPVGSSQESSHESLAAGCRQTRATSTRSHARTSRQFSNAKCEQIWHICQFFLSFCQVNKFAKPKCQTVG